MDFFGRRTLVQAMIVSLLIHAALLSGVVVLLPIKEVPMAAVINVVVKREGQHLEPVKPVSELVTKPRAIHAGPSGEPSRRATEQAIIAADHGPDSTALPPPASPAAPQALNYSPPVPTVPVAAANDSSGSVSSTGTTAKPATFANASDGISTNEMTEFRLSLSRAARRFKSYPRLARERGWEGTAEVALIFNAHSSLPDVTLLSSSGREILDEQALDMVMRAARSTVLPPALKGRDFKVALPVKFSLDEDQ